MTAGMGAAMPGAAMGEVAAIPRIAPAVRLERLGRLMLSRAPLRLRCAAFDDLVELAPIEPDAAALRAIVDLDALAVAHRQRDPADRAVHGGDFILRAHRRFLSAWAAAPVGD